MEGQSNQSTVGDPSPKSLKNFAEAKSHRMQAGTRVIEWKFWTGRCCLWPVYLDETCYMMFDGDVRWRRCYWLTFGVSVITPLR